MLSINTVFYKFVRIHKTFKMKPAIETRITDELFEIKDMVKIIDAAVPKQGRANAYKKRNS